MRQTLKRIRQIAEFASKADALTGTVNMAVLGYARGHSLGGNDFTARIGRKFYPELVVRPRLYKGLRLAMDPTDISHMVVAEEILIENVYDLALIPFEPEVILDCGAHIGMFTLLAASHFPKARIVCFEPNSQNLQWLRKQVTRNELEAEIIAAAVSTRNGEASFSASCSFGGSIVRDKEDSGAVTIQVIRLADFLASLNCRRLLLKLDVEGEETVVLPDIVPYLPEQCVIFLETHNGEESWNQASQLMSANGFTVQVVRRRGPYTDGAAFRSQHRTSTAGAPKA